MIKITRPAKEEIEKLGVFKWPVWEKEKSKFDWHYDSIETCYILAGKAVVEYEGGKKVEFSKGDLVAFPRGLSCVWEIKEDIRKHYKFG